LKGEEKRQRAALKGHAKKKGVEPIASLEKQKNLGGGQVSWLATSG